MGRESALERNKAGERAMIPTHHVVGKKIAGEGDLNGSLDLVTRENLQRQRGTVSHRPVNKPESRNPARNSPRA